MTKTALADPADDGRPDPYRWEPNAYGIVHPGYEAPGDACSCAGCVRRAVERRQTERKRK